MFQLSLVWLCILPNPGSTAKVAALDCFTSEEEFAVCCCRSQGACTNQDVYDACCEHLSHKCNDPVEQLAHASGSCMQGTVVGQFGAVSGWTAFGWSGPKRRKVWIELFMLRPILVGWLQGNRTPIFRLLGRSGPKLMDLSSGETPISQPNSIHVQPYDVVGWSIADAEENMPGMLPESHTCGKYNASATICVSYEPCQSPDSATVQCNNKAACPSLHAGFAVSNVQVSLDPPAQIARHFNVSPYPVRASLNISRFVELTTSYEEFMSLRNHLNSSDLGVFEDKIRLRRELLPESGVPATPTIYMSNTDFDVLPYIINLEKYVVKPSHMSNSDYVFVVVEGTNVNSEANFESDDNKRTWALNVTPEMVQNAVHAFVNESAVAWECNALVEHTRPGVIVEEAILGGIPIIGDQWREKHFVNEYKFFTVWGEVVVAENILSGTPYVVGDNRIEIPRIVPHNKHHFQSVVPCYPEMVFRAELVARSAQADFLRVDFLVEGYCDEVFVSEVELFPARQFTPEVMELMAERWRIGYGVYETHSVPLVSLQPLLAPKLDFYAPLGRACKFLDLSLMVQPGWNFNDFLLHRLSLPKEGLRLFEDKIRLRRELLPALDIQSTPSVFLSNVDFKIASVVRGLKSFVVKPSHLSFSDYVLLMQHGFNIMRHVTGDVRAFLSYRGIQSIVDTFARKETLGSDEDRSTALGIEPGVVVEELIMFEHFKGIRKINEYRFHVVWGEVVHSEMLFVGLPTRLHLDRAGRPIFLEEGMYPCECNVSTCIDCVAECYSDMVELAEKLAQKVHADYIRIDVLIKGRCQDLFVSKCNLFPQVYRPELEGIIARRWRSGYGFGQHEIAH